MGVIRTLSIGAPPSLAGNANGAIYGVNGIDRPFVRDPINGIRNWGISAPPAAPGLAAGAAGNPDGTLLYKVTWENQNAGIYGLYSDAATITVTADQVTITRPSIAGIDSQVTHWVWWRTTDGQATTYYRGASVAIGTANDTDNLSDDTISAGEVLEEHSPPDGMFRYIKEFKGQMALYGSRVESRGTVSINTGTDTVTGVGTQFSAEHVGEKMWFTGDATVYTIESVASATSLVLTTNKSGTVNGVAYKIVAADPHAMTLQRADDESFEAAERWTVFPGDGDFPTGLVLVGNTLCPCKDHHVYGYDFSADPNPGTSAVVYPILKGRGLVNEWCAVGDGPTAYMLDRQGIYQFDGAGQAEPIDQAIRRFFRPDSGVATEDRINWAYTDTWRGVFDPVTRQAKWAVTTGSDTSPQTILCFDVERQFWTVERHPHGVRAFAVEQDSTGVLRAWKMDNLSAPAAPWAMGCGRGLDGTASGTIAGTSTASGATTLTDGTASFYTTGDGLKGVPVVAFTTPYQIRVISSNTGTQLTVSSAWDSNPANGTKYRVGAVETRQRWNWLTFDPQARQTTQMFHLFFEPTATDIYLFVRLFKDFSSTPILAWEPMTERSGVEIPFAAKTDGWLIVHANESGGRVSLRLPQNAIRAFSVEIMQLDANNPVIVEGWDLDIQPIAKVGRAD